MSRKADIAEALLRVLSAHVEDADKWEAYYTDYMETGFDGKRRDELLVTSTQPLMTLIKREGFRYEEIITMIPVSFATTYEERDQILTDLTDHVYSTYDTGVPF